ncbi:FtsW/RodA/SpoVE family cell cycle protein [Corynebacterium xerosis]|uniref:FtsW/RodA/SpoVE family cell cycle protein n=2 Tax=Corynebacterium xerosis TaxID=1725 RepID=A0ABV3UXA8_9CORY|nr:FtsW/RodA/SpoVE family cell cycle protein [Corynebacterium xerosis]SQB96213.1 cell cycle protein [Clostridium paraputrificum]HJG58312.1 FtsW/RodA/SpoVE family cell cycle protein [Corynebacterium xerosis]
MTAPRTDATARPGRSRELLMLLLAGTVTLLALISAELGQGNTATIEMLWILGGFILVFGVAHAILRFLAPWSDQVLLPVVAALNGLGLVMIHRLDMANGTSLVRSQVMWTVLGVAMFVAVMVLLRDHRSLSRYSYILGLVGLLLLALPLVWPSSINSDARIWISIGPFSVQPGEFAKVLLLIFFAQLLVNKRSLFNVAGKRVLGIDFPRLRDLGPILVVWGIALVIMALQNDFGPALLLFGTVLGMLYIATARGSWLLIGLILVAVGGFGVYQVSAKIQDRVSHFVDPLANYDSGGYQLSQALFGMSWGGVTGTGLGNGYPQNVPVAHSDFILAAFGEELGFVGLAAIILLFAILIARGMNAAMQVRDSFGKLLASGLALTIAIQVFVVVAGISKLMPLTGLTTPFMSAGGSSLLANYILLAILLRISDSARRPWGTTAPAQEPAEEVAAR